MYTRRNSCSYILRKIDKAILLFIIAAASILATFISPEMGLMKEYFSLANEQLGMIMTYYLTGYLIGQGIWAYSSNKIGIKASIIAGEFIAITGSILLLYSFYFHNFHYFIVGRFLIGFGLSSGLTCGFAIVKECLALQKQKNYLALIAIFFTASIYISISFSGYIVQSSSLNIVLWINTLLCFCFFVLGCLINAPKNKLKRDIQIKRRTKNNEYTKLMVYSLILSITTIISYCYALYAPLITNQLLSLSPESYSNYSLLNMVSIFLGSFLFLILNKIYSEKTICIFGLGIIILSSLCLITNCYYLDLSTNTFFFYCSLLNLSSGMIYPASTYLALDFNGCKSKASGIMNSIKLLLPVIAIYFSTRIFDDSLQGFSVTILFFSLSYLFALYATKKYIHATD